MNRLSCHRFQTQYRQEQPSLPHIGTPKFGCAQFAHLVREPYKGEDQFIKQCLVTGTNALQTQSEKNPDGWGIASFHSGDQVSIAKSKITAKDDPNFEAVVNNVADNQPLVTLGHVRQGANVSVKNNHPFPIGKAVLMHNGNVPDAIQAELRAQLDSFPKEYHITPPVGTTDTELVARYLQGQLSKNFSTNDPTQVDTQSLATFFNQHISQLIDRSKAIPNDGPIKHGFNFTLADDHRIIASRSGRRLYLGFRLDEYGNYQDVAIATKPMQVKTGEPLHWQEIPDNYLVVVERATDAQGKPDIQITREPLAIQLPDHSLSL